jgi:hypothetical protein
VGICQRTDDIVNNTIRILQDVGVPESNYPITILGECAGSRFVLFMAAGMLAAI